MTNQDLTKLPQQWPIPNNRLSAKNALLALTTFSGLLCGGQAFSQAAAAQNPAPPNTLVGAISGGHLLLDMRLRTESVDQTGIAHNGLATTLRTRLGWETARYNGFAALVEFEDVRAISSDYNSTLNGKTTYPNIADPEVTELNRAQISYTNGPGFTATVGRQRINMDNQRFIGAVGWRQDEQTFDAARADFAHGPFKFTYAYVWQANRIFAEAQDWRGDTHLFNANYKANDALQLQGFGYLLDFSNTPTLAAANASTDTYGARAYGVVPISGNRLSYSATYASQTDAGLNPANFDLNYLGLETSLQHGPFMGRIAYERAQGNGSRSFATPLATAHAFQGWSDAFDINNPTQLVNGVADFNLTAGYHAPAPVFGLRNLDVTLRYHDFQTEQLSADLGSELDFQLTGAITPQLALTLKAADYSGANGFADRTKVWLGFEFKL